MLNNAAYEAVVDDLREHGWMPVEEVMALKDFLKMNIKLHTGLQDASEFNTTYHEGAIRAHKETLRYLKTGIPF